MARTSMRFTSTMPLPLARRASEMRVAASDSPSARMMAAYRHGDKGVCVWKRTLLT